MRNNLRLIFWFSGLIALTCGSAWAQRGPANYSPEEIAAYKAQMRELVSFVEFTFNTLGDSATSVREKETIFRESYRKAFRDEKVQVEDDLDNREVITYKPVQAYLKDIDFFFRQARFELQIEDISHYVSENDGLYFRARLNRNLQAITLEGTRINRSQVRFVEANLDARQNLQIVSYYTTQMSRRDELRAWWERLSPEWQAVLAAQVGLDLIGDTATYRAHQEIVALEALDLSGETGLWDLEPLSKLTNLRRLDISNTFTESLVPLRSLTRLEVLRANQTRVANLSPLRYAHDLRELELASTPLSDLSVVASFVQLEKLDLRQTSVRDLAPLQALSTLRVLRVGETAVTDLTPLQTLSQLVLLDLSGTPVADLSPLQPLAQLEHLNVERTDVRALQPLSRLASLRILHLNQTDVASLQPLHALAKLEKVYGDRTPIGREEVGQLRAVRPAVLVIFESGQLQSWWRQMPEPWREVMRDYVPADSITNEVLARMTAQAELDLTGRADLADLTPLRRLTNLRALHLGGTGVRSLEPLRDLLELETLVCSQTAISDLEPLRPLVSLRTLRADQTQVATLTPLHELTRLELLSCDQTNVTAQEVRALVQAQPGCLVIFQTETLRAWWAGLSPAWQGALGTPAETPSARQLHELIFRHELDLGRAAIDDLTPLRPFLRLTVLRFSGSNVRDLSPLSALTTLQTLLCPQNPVEDLAPLAGLVGLRHLNIENTPVSDLRPLQSLDSLEVLQCGGTPVRSLRPLAGLTQLETLECFSTGVRSLAPLRDLDRLQLLKCYNTRVSGRQVSKFREWHPQCQVVYY